MQILSVDEMGEGIKPIRPQSLVDMMKVGLHHCLCKPWILSSRLPPVKGLEVV